MLLLFEIPAMLIAASSTSMLTQLFTAMSQMRPQRYFQRFSHLYKRNMLIRFADVTKNCNVKINYEQVKSYAGML